MPYRKSRPLILEQRLGPSAVRSDRTCEGEVSGKPVRRSNQLGTAMRHGNRAWGRGWQWGSSFAQVGHTSPTGRAVRRSGRPSGERAVAKRGIVYFQLKDNQLGKNKLGGLPLNVEFPR